MKIKRYIVEGSIEENYRLLSEIKEDLGKFDEQYEIFIILKDIVGGDIAEIFELISRIKYSLIKVTIAAHGMLISAGAFLYFRLLLNQEEFENLTVLPLASPILAIFHRPRQEEGDYIKFAENIPKGISKENMPKDLGERTALIDEVFEQIIKHQGFIGSVNPPTNNAINLSKLEHIRKIYYSNGDYVFHYFNEAFYE